jgi:hypothetical protein
MLSGGLTRLPLLHPIARHAGRAVDTVPGCRAVLAPGQTPVGCQRDDETLSSRLTSARWRCGLGLIRCWSPASAGLRAQHTSAPSSAGTSVGRAPHSPFLRCKPHGRLSSGAIDLWQSLANPSAGVPSTIGYGTGSVKPSRGGRPWEIDADGVVVAGLAGRVSHGSSSGQIVSPADDSQWRNAYTIARERRGGKPATTKSDGMCYV